MPQKINMFLSNRNNISLLNNKNINTASLAGLTNSHIITKSNNITGSASLKSSIIGRIHNVKPGCGSCGRH